MEFSSDDVTIKQYFAMLILLFILFSLVLLRPYLEPICLGSAQLCAHIDSCSSRGSFLAYLSFDILVNHTHVILLYVGPDTFLAGYYYACSILPLLTLVFPVFRRVFN